MLNKDEMSTMKYCIEKVNKISIYLQILSYHTQDYIIINIFNQPNLKH